MKREPASPLISIIPAHNAAPWLPETPASIARQTYPEWKPAITLKATRSWASISTEVLNLETEMDLTGEQ
jgi:hypothetical protein